MSITYATLDPGNLGTSLTLSGSDLIVTRSGNGAWASAISTIGKASGKWYWEVTMSTDTDMMMGAGELTGFPNQFPGGTSTSWGWYDSGSIYNNAGVVTTVTGHTTGDILGFALDMDGATLKMYLNNTLKYTASSLANTYYAILGLDANNDQATANFGASAFTYTPPSGYNSGLYTGTATSIKTANGLAEASVKTVNGLARASVKTINGLA